MTSSPPGEGVSSAADSEWMRSRVSGPINVTSSRRSSRAKAMQPRVGLMSARPIGEHDGWCDDPRAPTYNRLVRIPNDWSHEKMWRDDGLYDLVVVIGYNDDPPEGEWGSAIFLHVAKEDYSPTQGCVAFKREDLLQLVSLIGPETKINVLSIPANETTPKTSGDDMKQFEDFDEQDW